MELELFIAIGYTCPKCKHKFEVTLRDIFYGRVKCPRCEIANKEAISGKSIRTFNGMDKAILSLETKLNAN